MNRAILLALAAMLLCGTHVSAQPIIVESGWVLIRTVPFENPIAAHFNPVDGRIYVGRRESDLDGLYRIDAMGFTGLIAGGPYLAGVIADPLTGHVFAADSYTGVIYRSQLDDTGRSVWVSGFHTGDDDPMGMDIAGDDYTGDVLLPGEALVVDMGYSGPDEVWRWSPASAEGEVLVHADVGTLIEAVDIAIGTSTIHLVDGGETAPGVIYELGIGGVLTPLSTSEPLADPFGITYDPLTGDLLVLDQGSDRVVRIDPDTGALGEVLTGVHAESGWAGIDITADGRQLLVTAYGDDALYVFARCDATGDPEIDCDGNGVYDICDIAAGAPDCNGNGKPDDCDLASGASDDCNNDGVPDDCPSCPPLEVVFIMDTSTSMDDEAAILCGSMGQVVTALEAAGLDVTPRLLGICDLPGGAYSCLETHVSALLGTSVPGDPPVGLEILGNCPGGNEVCQEDWALATAVVAGLYPWQPVTESIRLVIPLADEGPWCGDPVTVTDTAAVDHAITVANASGVVVSPITGSGSSSQVKALAQALADSTGGRHFSSSTPTLDITSSIVDLVLAACLAYTDCNGNGVLDECDIDSGFSTDLNGDGIPDECGGASGVDRIPNRTGMIELEQNVPNPFNPSTAIAFTLRKGALVNLSVYAPDGRRVAVLAEDWFGPGRHLVEWYGRDASRRRVSSGMYFYRLTTADAMETRRMILLK